MIAGVRSTETVGSDAETMTMDAQVKAGEIRRFGSVGPLYEVLTDPGSASPETDVCIRLIETGELADYPRSQLIRDPVVH